MEGTEKDINTDVKKRYEHIKTCVERESDLVIKWLTMLIAINAGFFLAYREVYEKSEVFWLTGAVCAAGILTSGFITFAISSADEQFKYLRDEYFALESDLEGLRFPRPFGDEHEQHSTAWIPKYLYRVFKYPQLIPAIFALIWLIAFAVSGHIWANE